jgi:hypothetical protein
MAFNLPIYKIVGKQPIKWVKTADGGSIILAWNFAEKNFVQAGAPEFDSFMEYELPGDGDDVRNASTPIMGGIDVRTVTKAEFDAHVEDLKAEEK